MLIFTQHKPSGSWPGLAVVLHLLLFLPASSSQAEKELTDSPATSKRISFPGSSESSLSSKRSKTSEETKAEQVRRGGGLRWGSVSGTGGEWIRGRVCGVWADTAAGGNKIQPERWVYPHRCTSVPTASIATPMSTGSGCTPWRSTQYSPCSAAPCARTCSTTRFTCSYTSPTCTVWRPTAWRSSSWR